MIDQTKGTIHAGNAKDFENAYRKAVSDGAVTFTFEGQDILTSYAKYALQYIKQSKGGV